MTRLKIASTVVSLPYIIILLLCPRKLQVEQKEKLLLLYCSFEHYTICAPLFKHSLCRCCKIKFYIGRTKCVQKVNDIKVNVYYRNRIIIFAVWKLYFYYIFIIVGTLLHTLCQRVIVFLVILYMLKMI